MLEPQFHYVEVNDKDRRRRPQRVDVYVRNGADANQTAQNNRKATKTETRGFVRSIHAYNAAVLNVSPFSLRASAVTSSRERIPRPTPDAGKNPAKK